MKRNVFDDNIDFKALIGTFVAKWYYFVITVSIALVLAIIYYKLASKQYAVEATMQLNESTYNYGGKENPTVLADLMRKQTVIEDEIGLLSSYDIVGRTIRQLDFNISYFKQGEFLGIDKSTEIYKGNFKVKLTPYIPQPVYMKIFVEFLGSEKVKITAEGEEVRLYDMATKEALPDKVPLINFEKEQSVHAPVQSEYINFEIIPDSTAVYEPGDTYFFVINTEDNLIDKYRNKLTITRLTEESNIVQLVSTGNVVDKERDFLNTLMLTYIDNVLQKKNQFGLKAIEFIDSQLSEVSDSLENVEGTLQSFRTKNNIMNIRMTTENLTNRYNELEARRTELRIQNEYFKNIGRSLSKGSDLNSVVAPSSAGVSDPLFNSLLQELTNLQQQKVSASYSLYESSPVLKLLNEKIKNTQAALRENVDNLIESSQASINQIEREMRSYRQQLNELPQNERSLTDLQRKFTHNDNVYNYLLQKRAEAGIAVASNVADKSIVDEARMEGSGPKSPNLIKIVVLAILAGFLLPLGLIVVQDFFSSKIDSKDKLQGLVDIPILESIAYAEYTSNNKRGYLKNQVVVDESFKFARANLQYTYGNGSSKFIGVTSSIEGEGKTFCSAFLATSFARAGKRTLLICGDMHRPRINEYFKLNNSPGLADYLAGRVSFQQAVQETEINALNIIAPGKVMQEPSILLEQPGMYELVDEVKAAYDYVIMETPPVGYVADYLLIAKHFDINLLIVRQNYTDKKVLVSTEKLLNEKHVSNLNVLFNGVNNKNNTQYKYRKKVVNYQNV